MDSNIKVIIKDFNLTRTRHRAVEILIEQETSFKPNLKFKTRNADWEKCKQFLQAPLVNYSANFPLARNFRKIIDQQANNKLTELMWVLH